MTFTRIDNAVLDVLPIIGTTALAVYAVLKRRAYNAPDCWPSIKTIQDDVGLSRRGVQQALAVLSQRGLIQRTTQCKPNGVQTVNLYSFPIDLPPGRECAQNDEIGRTECAPGRTTCADEGARNDMGGAHPVRTEEDEVKKKTEGKKKAATDPAEVPIPSNLQTPRFLAAWAEWLAYRKESRKRVTPRGLTMQLRKLSAAGEAAAVAAIEDSISNEYSGLFPKPVPTKGTTNGPKPTGRIRDDKPITVDKHLPKTPTTGAAPDGLQAPCSTRT